MLYVPVEFETREQALDAARERSRLTINLFNPADHSSSAFLHNASKMELSTGVMCDS
jgi:hypothetical protein